MGLPGAYDRLAIERKKLGLSQPELGNSLGYTKYTQLQYEAGRRFPNACYLAGLHQAGFDVMYILTGTHSLAAPMPAEQQRLLAAYEAAPVQLRNAAFAVLDSANQS